MTIVPLTMLRRNSKAQQRKPSPDKCLPLVKYFLSPLATTISAKTDVAAKE